MASKSWWIFLALIGPLVGFSFIQAVRIYGEASGLGGTAAGVGEAFSPLVGIWAPTFSACELAAAFLLPFVAIRLVGLSSDDVGLKPSMREVPVALFMVPVGLAIGVIEYLALEPRPIAQDIPFGAAATEPCQQGASAPDGGWRARSGARAGNGRRRPGTRRSGKQAAGQVQSAPARSG